MIDDLKFYDSISPVFEGEKFLIPPPKLSPIERKIRRMSFRNEKSFYYRKCDLTGQRMLSIYPENSPYKVYHFKEWISDKWDALDYGFDPDFERSFFEQFDELLKKVPKMSLNISDTMENCDYCNYGGFSKNCYLCVSPFESENCYYSRIPYKCTYDVDGFFNIDCQYVYDCVICENCYELFFSEYCMGCKNSAFLIDCVGCKNCFGCVGLKNQEYCFLNKKYSREEYERLTEGILGDSGRLDEFKVFFAKESLKFPRRFARNMQSENCSGDLIRNSQNCHDCFDLWDQQDSRYCEIGGVMTRDVYDCTITAIGVERCYEQISCFGSYDCAFGVYVRDNNNCYYLMNCSNCKNCFGCEGLRYKEYCIFNKQYSKDEYEIVVAKLIRGMMLRGEWGEMFPTWMSAFAYNETMANDFFPLDKMEVLRRGWRWVDKDEGNGDFKILKEEREFLEKFGIALPVKSPSIRSIEQFYRVMPYYLWERQCASTGKKLLSPYAPGRPEIILSEEAYLNYNFLI